MSEPLTIFDAARSIQSGQLTPVDLLEQCLARVDLYEKHVHAWAYLDRDRARQDAKAIAAQLHAGQIAGPLVGIPIGIKDIIDVEDMPTACGSTRWATSFARADAHCVALLRQAGAIILGKTVTTAYAYLDPPKTRNPWNFNRTPGGSSSGSAAAVACGMCLAALGTQTGGSLTRPATYCGVASYKPAHGAITTDGVLPLAPSLDHIGIMARTVRDFPAFARVLHGVTIDWQPRQPPPHLARLGDYFQPSDPQVQRMADRFFEAIQPGTSPVESLPALFQSIPQHHLTIMAAEAAAVHSERQKRHPQDYPPKITELIEQGRTRTALELIAARTFRSEMLQSLRASFDLAAVPATSTLAPTPETTGSPAFNSPWSFLGLPTISLPVAESDEGLPLGMQLVGVSNDLDSLFQAAVLAETRFDRPQRLPPVPG
jgi:aspartyl-tRNA(Asn)/glutamyl-tRNA(Gln) amidotransferase subunit A